MVELFRKFENRGIKIARINSILIIKYISLVIYFKFVRCWGSVVMLTSKLTVSAQYIYRGL